MRKVLKNVLILCLHGLKYNETKIGRTFYWEFLKIKFFGTNIYWYHHDQCTIANPREIYVSINSLGGRPGCYIQRVGEVYVVDYMHFGPSVGVLSSHHDLYDQNKYNNDAIKIGDYSWISMNCVITSEVELGTRTIVAAGSVVTKSFPKGFCILGGGPTKVIKRLRKRILLLGMKMRNGLVISQSLNLRKSERDILMFKQI